MSQPALNLSSIIPADFLKSCLGERVSVSTIGNIEISGILKGYDDYCNLLLDDVVQTTFLPNGVQTANVDKIFLVSMRVTAITKADIGPYIEVKQ